MHAPRRTVARLASLVAAAAALLSCGGGGGGGGGGGSYQIQLEFETPVTDSQRAAFTGAAARIEQIVTTGLSTVTFDTIRCSGPCTCGSEGGTQYPVPASVKDLLIFVEVKHIDGGGGILGSSGPCYTRSSNGLPVVGIMTFDQADLATLETNGLLKNVVLHEMLHVLGFGTIWTDKSLLTGTSGGDPGFTGAGAIAAFHDLNGGTTATVPVEATGGSGTALSHWRESVFKNELMTGWISGSTQPLSATSVGSLSDLGYAVNLSRADAFNLATASNLRALEKGSTGEPAAFVGNDTRTTPPIPIDDAAP